MAARYLQTIMATALISVCVVSAQNRYNTSALQTLAERLSLTADIDTLPDSCYIGTYSYNRHPLTISVRNGNVEHIGYQLFGPQQRAGQYDYVYDFIERWILCNDLGLNTEARNSGNRSIRFAHGDLNALRSCTNDTTVSIEVQCYYDNRYELTWERNGQDVCRIVFPANYELISGSTMVENESKLQQRLADYRHQPQDSMPQTPDADMLKPGLYDETLLMLDLGHPRIESVGHHLFYELGADSIPVCVYSPFHPIESAANLLQSDMVDAGFTANVKLMKYNFSKEYFSVPLYDMIGYFLNEGCTPYFGLLKYDEDTRQVEGILEMHNYKLAYEHLMRVKIDMSRMSEPAGTAEITLTCYIPTTNFRANDTY